MTGIATGPAVRFPVEGLATSAITLDQVARRVRADLPAETPAALLEQLEMVHVPIAALLAERRAGVAGRPVLVGLGGGQGAGKSTLAALLVRVIERGFGLRAVALSLDDFYLTRAERQGLSAAVHPELATRGPGTHDVGLIARTLSALRDAGSDCRVRVPRFDKARDDRVPETAWPVVHCPLDVVLLEGVLVGVPPEPEVALHSSINDFERDADPDGRLRRHAQAQHVELAQVLDRLLDVLLFLAVPDLERVLVWRSEQERGLGIDPQGTPRGMDAPTLARFVARFERLTRHALRTVPKLADVTLELDAGHRVCAVRLSPRAAPSAAR